MSMEQRPVAKGSGVGVSAADVRAIVAAAERMQRRADVCADCRKRPAVLLRRTRAKWSGVCRECSGTTGTRRPAVRAGAPRRMDTSVAQSWRRLGAALDRF